MVDAGFVVFTIVVGLFSGAYTFWWTRWIFEENPGIPATERQTLHSIVVFALLTCSWFFAFAMTQEDIGNLPAAEGRGSVLNLTIVTYAVICTVISLSLFLWDSFCRGKNCRGQPPHLIPSFYAAITMCASCFLVVPGFTLLAVHSKESSEALSYPHQDYIESLSMKGIVAVSSGLAIDGGILLLYLKQKFVTRNTAQTSESETVNVN